ncbi:sulfur acclimation 1 protein [Dorcoceras hygrometricum]|uniref:Sulfur acclimation 1 protein n=1 Tax=Dorcoceras hygrometricum TaxID=472368 RepID=A0A2Z7BNC4_9LAMI|nr:sulfur acclimation 1 protein [Dorcoceras hygrometricum]
MDQHICLWKFGYQHPTSPLLPPRKDPLLHNCTSAATLHQLNERIASRSLHCGTVVSLFNWRRLQYIASAEISSRWKASKTVQRFRRLSCLLSILVQRSSEKRLDFTTTGSIATADANKLSTEGTVACDWFIKYSVWKSSTEYLCVATRCTVASSAEITTQSLPAELLAQEQNAVLATGSPLRRRFILRLESKLPADSCDWMTSPDDVINYNPSAESPYDVASSLTLCFIC